MPGTGDGESRPLTQVTKMEKIEYLELYPTEVQRMYCRQCSTYLDLSYIDFEKMVSNIAIFARELPTLVCSVCGATYLPDRSRIAIIRLYEEAYKEGRTEVRVTREKLGECFGFTTIPFKYDADDYYCIPGLCRENGSGFLTPVFFNRRVLIKFHHSEDYEVQFASRTYGTGTEPPK